MRLDQNLFKISVIVTTFNREVFLVETIKSILSQTIKPHEIIIIDNYSNYPVSQVIEKLDSTIKIFQNDNKGIIAINRNFGIQKASGNYLAFCDDDDVWEETKLEKQINLLNESNCDFVSSNIQEFTDSTIGVISKYKPISATLDLIKRNQICLSSVIVRNSKEVMFRTDKHLLGIEDYELWIRLSLQGYRFGLINEPLVKYRVSNFSTSELKRLLIEKNKIQYFRSIGALFIMKLHFLSTLILIGRIIKSSIRILIIKMNK